jgi:hypothetical protein
VEERQVRGHLAQGELRQHPGMAHQMLGLSWEGNNPISVRRISFLTVLQLYTPGPGETLSNYEVHLKNGWGRILLLLLPNHFSPVSLAVSIMLLSSFVYCYPDFPEIIFLDCVGPFLSPLFRHQRFNV